MYPSSATGEFYWRLGGIGQEDNILASDVDNKNHLPFQLAEVIGLTSRIKRLKIIESCSRRHSDNLVMWGREVSFYFAKGVVMLIATGDVELCFWRWGRREVFKGVCWRRSWVRWVGLDGQMEVETGSMAPTMEGVRSEWQISRRHQ